MTTILQRDPTPPESQRPMAEPFDPYRKWLGIPPKEQPPHHYRLLGIATFEDDPDVIENAAARQMAHVRTFQTSKQHGPISQRILTELSAAKVCLLTPDRKAAYDAQLREGLAAAGGLSSTELTGAAAADAIEEAPEPDLPPLRTGGEFRWRTGAAEAVREPPPVPIPIPPLVAGSMTNTPDFPAFRPTAKPTTAARTYRKQSAVPVVIIAASLIGLAALGGVAIVLANRQGSHAVHQPNPKPAATSGDKSRPKPSGSDKTSAAKTSGTATAFPVGSAAQGASATPFPVPPPVATIEPAPPRPASQATRGELGDRMRQLLYLSEQALQNRDDDEFRQQFALAEQLVVNKDLPEQEQFTERVDDLRVVKQLNDEFWAIVRDNLHNQLQPGDKIEFHQHKLELTSLEGEMVAYTLNGVQHSGEIQQLEPKAAILIASKSVKWEDPVTFLPIAAFLSVDGKVTEESEKKFGKQLFAIGRLIGKANPALARKFGLKDLNEEIKLDDLTGQIPLPLPETKPE